MREIIPKEMYSGSSKAKFQSEGTLIFAKRNRRKPTQNETESTNRILETSDKLI
jgi:hypothetical protein